MQLRRKLRIKLTQKAMMPLSAQRKQRPPQCTAALQAGRLHLPPKKCRLGWLPLQRRNQKDLLRLLRKDLLRKELRGGELQRRRRETRVLQKIAGAAQRQRLVGERTGG